MIENPYYSQEGHGPYELHDIGDLDLEEGGTIRGCKLAVATHGTLNAAKDNAILVPTWYSGTSKIIEQVYIGKGRDPDKYFIVVVNQIGNGLSSSPHNTPAPDGMANFPKVRIGDDVRAQHQLLTERFGLTSLALVVGGSMGAQQTYEWAVRYPEMVKRAAPIAGTAKNTDHDFLFTETLVEAITSDPAFAVGHYEQSSDVEEERQRSDEQDGPLCIVQSDGGEDDKRSRVGELQSPTRRGRAVSRRRRSSDGPMPKPKSLLRDRVRRLRLNSQTLWLWIQARGRDDKGFDQAAYGSRRRLGKTYFSLNERISWSLNGFIRYDSMVRSPVCTKASTGMPGMIFTSSPRRATSFGGIETRMV